ncbi:hypothetical protein PMAYCL1PPCAC_22275, partial [Pristionchus mayeri]
SAVATECDKCNFTADSSLVQSSCTTIGNPRLSCGGADLIKHGENSFDNVVCLYDEWYGVTCDGKVSLLGASVDVSCPFTCATTCVSEPVPSIEEASKATCLDGKEMRTCDSGDLSVEIASGNFSFSKAVCLPGEKWLAYNCDGTAKLIAGSLKAKCKPALACPALGEITPAELAARYPGAVYEKAVVTASGASCSNPAAALNIKTKESIVAMDKITLECANGEWFFVSSTGERGELSQLGITTTSVCCSSVAIV